MTFGDAVLESLPQEQQDASREAAYEWLASRLREQTRGQIALSAGAIEHWIAGRRTPPGGVLGPLAAVLGWSDAQMARAVRLLAGTRSEKRDRTHHAQAA